jgi:hypothetical protein
VRAYRSEIEDAVRFGEWAGLIVNGLGILRWLVGCVLVYHFAVKYW